MKEKKNILLLIGVVLALFPFGVYLITRFGGYLRLLSALTSRSVVWFFSLFALNVVFYSAVAILAISQLRNNCRHTGKRAIPIIGIVLSGLYLAYYIFSIPAKLPSGLLYNYLGLLTVIKTLFFKNLSSVAAPVGHILLVIGFVKSLPKKKVFA